MSMGARFTLRIPAAIHQAMLEHATAELPNECVGMLAGLPSGLVVARYPLINLLADPTRFESEPRSMFLAEKARRQEGLEFLAVYHSHPTTPAVPSRHDLAWHYVPEVQCVIISLSALPPQVRSYWLDAEGFTPAQLHCIEDQDRSQA